MTVRVRAYRQDDAPALARVLFDAVRIGAAEHYTYAQREAWAPQPPDPAGLAARLSEQTCFVAEDARGVAGFAAYDASGHLDLLHVRPDLRGTGTAGLLHDAVIDHARAAGLTALTVEASHPARRFLARLGWTLIETQTVTRNGVGLQNHRMIFIIVGDACDA
ncbi:GNAT family N-acetyltransferase [Marinicauda salina]|uniref:GNAT family N-acetyltransferase n=1 Tax=Marinicauda salina TaxID=2135793 RepID=A0A2U2BTM9_9PROT|nr:GNAT family N-acetyltransferase [Marinicauda salina]PWE17358.1 GNAT family N-acetyltransferase [Marinicauda salina]